MTDDEVLRGIQALVDAGEYLDELLGVPGARLSGGGAFKGDQRLYARGTPEHLEARAAGLVEKLPPLKPASIDAVEAAERRFGHAFPSLLRRLYLEVGNGGFGPGYGIMGFPRVTMTRTPARSPTLGHRNTARPDSKSLFPLCTWGCGIYSFVDCTDTEARMWAWDPNPAPHDDIGKALFQEELSLREWLGRWVDRRSFQPTLVQDEAANGAEPLRKRKPPGWLSSNAVGSHPSVSELAHVGSQAALSQCKT